MPITPLARVSLLHKALRGDRRVQQRLDSGCLSREDSARIADLADVAERDHPPGSLQHEYIRELVDELRHWLTQARRAS